MAPNSHQAVPSLLKMFGPRRLGHVTAMVSNSSLLLYYHPRVSSPYDGPVNLPIGQVKCMELPPIDLAVFHENGYVRRQCRVTDLWFWTTDGERDTCGDTEEDE